MGESSRNLQDTGERLGSAPLLFQQIVNLLAGQGLGYQVVAEGLYGEDFLLACHEIRES